MYNILKLTLSMTTSYKAMQVIEPVKYTEYTEIY